MLLVVGNMCKSSGRCRELRTKNKFLMSKVTTCLWGAMEKAFSIVLILLLTNTLNAQPRSSLGIDDVYQLARKNYPLIKQRDLITRTKEYTVSNAARGYLPSFLVAGQATYQSAVTDLPFKIPGVVMPTFSKASTKYMESLTKLYMMAA